MNDSMRIYTISKGRFSYVARLLASLDASCAQLGRFNVEAYVVFDDCRCDDLIRRLEVWSSGLERVKVSGVRRAECAALIEAESKRWPCQCRELMPTLLRMPRNGAWEPGSIRNIVRAHARRDKPDICFWIDDDIVFGSHDAEGALVVGEGAILLQAMADQLDGVVLAVGCKYVGRYDLSLAEHAAQVLRGAHQEISSDPCIVGDCLRILETVPNSLPVVLKQDEADHAEAYHGPAGVSSGCLALKWESRDYPPIPHWYNEDWIWLSLLGPSERRVRRVDRSIVHAPPATPGLDVKSLVHQQVGEAVYEVASEVVPPNELEPQQRAAALAEAPDGALTQKLREGVGTLIEISEKSMRLADELNSNHEARDGALRMGEIFARAAEILQFVQSRNASHIGYKLRAYGRLVMLWVRHH